jgi:hypothetical protein
MSVRFPRTCKLTEAEQNALRQILSEDENPCVDCAWRITCDGPVEQRKVEESLFVDPDQKCLICGSPSSNERASKLIDGTFRFCDINEDEFVFTPSNTVDSSSPESIDF